VVAGGHSLQTTREARGRSLQGPTDHRSAWAQSNVWAQSNRARVLHHYTGILHYSNPGASHPTAQDVKSWKWKSGGTAKDITTIECVRGVCIIFDGFDIGKLDGILD